VFKEKGRYQINSELWNKSNNFIKEVFYLHSQAYWLPRKVHSYTSNDHFTEKKKNY